MTDSIVHGAVSAEEADAAALLRAFAHVDGFLGACLVDPGSGTVIGTHLGPDPAGMAPLAAGAADILDVLTVMGAQWAVEADVEDLVVTLTDRYCLVRVLERGPGETRLLVVTLDRSRCRLAIALRELRSAGEVSVG